MKIDTRDKKPKVFSIAAISVIAAVLFAVFALCSGGRASLCISVLLCVYLAAAAGDIACQNRLLYDQLP